MLFVLLSPIGSIGLVKPCRRWDLCDWRLLNPRPSARVGPRAHHVLLASGVPYRRTCSSLGVVGLTFMILLVDGFKLSLKRILMCLLIQSEPNRAAYHLSASTDVRLGEFD